MARNTRKRGLGGGLNGGPQPERDPVIPEFSPIFETVKVERIAKLEVHIRYEDADGKQEWAEVGDVPVHAGWSDIQRIAGGGMFKVSAKGFTGNGYLDNARKRLDGPPKYLKKIREREREERDDPALESDTELDEIRTEIRAITRQQAQIIPEAFRTTNAALVQLVEGSVARGIAAAKELAAVVSNHATQLDTMIKAHNAESDRYRARVGELERQVDKLTLENAGYLRASATARPVSEWIEGFKAIVAEAPKMRGAVSTVRELWRGELAAGDAAKGDAKQLAAGANGAGAPAAAPAPFGD